MTEPEQTPTTTLGRIRMGKPTGYPPPTKLNGPFSPNPLHRVREFLRQHGLMEGGDREQIAQVHHASGQMSARLNTTDLRFMLDSMDKIRDLAYRANGGGDQLVMSLIHGLASGSGAGMPAPPVERPPRVDIGLDGSLASGPPSTRSTRSRAAEAPGAPAPACTASADVVTCPAVRGWSTACRSAGPTSGPSAAP